MRISDWSSDVCSSDLVVEMRRDAAEDGDPLALDERQRRAGAPLRHEDQRAAQRDRRDQRHEQSGHMIERHVAEEAVADARPHGEADLGSLLQHAMIVHRSEEHTSELQSLMRISYAVFCLKKKKKEKKRSINKKQAERKYKR